VPFRKRQILEITLELDSGHRHVELFGAADSHLRLLRESLGIRISARGSSLVIAGEDSDVEKATLIIDKMQKHLSTHHRLTTEDVSGLISGGESRLEPKASGGINVYSQKKAISPFTLGQQKYVETMQANDLTFCTGPAGTGKTYLAVAVAVSMLKRKQIRRLVLARPAVEAGEKLGFLPGDLQAKVNPYLRPLFDALEDMMDFSQMRKFLDLDVIEIIPLAFMRGRTLNESVIICDEAQNTSPLQMLMVLTRLGQGSKMIITGDITQIDLGPGQRSGMVKAIKILRRIKGIGVVELSESDIVRHRLVQNIVTAYGKNAESGNNSRQAKPG